MVWNEIRRRPEYLNNVHVRFGKECLSRWEYAQVKAWAKVEGEAFSTDDDLLSALHKLRNLISSSSPEQLDKARKRHVGLLKTRAPVRVGDYVVDAVDDGYAHDGKPIAKPPRRPKADAAPSRAEAPPTAMDSPDESLAAPSDGIRTYPAALVSTVDALPKKAAPRGRGRKKGQSAGKTPGIDRATSRVGDVAPPPAGEKRAAKLGLPDDDDDDLEAFGSWSSNDERKDK